MSPSKFVKKLVILSDRIVRLSLNSSNWFMMTDDADMLDARTLSPKSCTAMPASASSRDRGMMFSEAYSSGSNCFAILATLAILGWRFDVHGWSSSHDTRTVAKAKMKFTLDLSKTRSQIANVVNISSIGVVWNLNLPW
jgi:hypothetical protein